MSEHDVLEVGARRGRSAGGEHSGEDRNKDRKKPVTKNAMNTITKSTTRP